MNDDIHSPELKVKYPLICGHLLLEHRSSIKSGILLTRIVNGIGFMLNGYPLTVDHPMDRQLLDELFRAVYAGELTIRDGAVVAVFLKGDAR
jgi:hypothetical protein